MTSNVIVFLILIVMVVDFMYVKALPSPPDGELVHGQKVSVDLFVQKKAQIFNIPKNGDFLKNFNFFSDLTTTTTSTLATATTTAGNVYSKSYLDVFIFLQFYEFE